MIFKLHYWFLTAGASALGILLGAFLQTYTDASELEIGALFMMMPFLGLIFRPIICSYADRLQAHQSFMLWSLFLTAASYLPFVIIPILGESFYKGHPRLSWYVLIGFKTVGDLAFGGVSSIGDSMAINYARRIGTEYGIYRIWGTISWIIFGLIIGQINEIWFLPKYVPAFIILILSSLLDMSLFWLWPKEYFRMVTLDEIEAIEASRQAEEQQEGGDSNRNSKLNLMTRSLMPREVVWAHMKRKMRSVFCCCSLSIGDYGNESLLNANYNQAPSSFAVVINSQEQLANGHQTTGAIATNREEERGINKMTQVRILFLLIRRDIRISLYFVLFILAGLNLMSANFFFMSLKEICQDGGKCNYSSLGGLLQATMASAETVLFIYIKEFQNFFGRINLAGISLLLLAIKFGFYGTIWTSVNPYYSLCIELIHGVVYGILLTLQVETAHEFANEVEYLLPELRERKVVKEEDDVKVNKLKLSLSATMQSVMTCANDGVGRGFGALVYGFVIKEYSYIALWRGISVGAGIFSLIIFAMSIVQQCFKLKLSLKNRGRRRHQSIIAEETNGEVDGGQANETQTEAVIKI